MHVVRHVLLRVPLLITGRPGASLVVQIPVEGVERHDALRCLQAERRNALQIEDQRDDLLLLAEIELGGLLDRVDGVAAGIGEPDHLGAGGLRLEQEG